MHKKLRNILLVGLLCGASVAQAQLAPDPVEYVVTPEVPGPFQQVTIEAQGVGTFIGDATITWQQDGKTVRAGAGERTYAFTTGGIGSITRVKVTIVSNTTGTFTREFVFRPSSVNLVWEADTSVPPLYKGKALYSAGSTLSVIAFPSVVINNARVAASSLSYQWSRGGEPLPSQSGLGRRGLTIEGDQLQPGEDISVDVYFGTSLVGRGSIGIPATSPQVLLYERDSLRGTVYDAALPLGISLNTKEITFMAQPYYFARSSVAQGQVTYAWTLNGEEITGPDSARGILTLRQTGTGRGEAQLGVELQNNNQNQLVQAASQALRIVFGQPGTETASFLNL